MEPTPEILSVIKLVDKGILTFLKKANEFKVGEYH